MKSLVTVAQVIDCTRRSQVQVPLGHCRSAGDRLYQEVTGWSTVHNTWAVYCSLLPAQDHRTEMRTEATCHRLEYLLVGCIAQWAGRRSLAGELTLFSAQPAADG